MSVIFCELFLPFLCSMDEPVMIILVKERAPSLNLQRPPSISLEHLVALSIGFSKVDWARLGNVRRV